LALAIRSVEVDPEDSLFPVHYVRGYASPPGALPDSPEFGVRHHPKELQRYFDESILNGILQRHRPYHQHPVVSGNVIQGMAHQSRGIPLTSFRCTQLGDADPVLPCPFTCLALYRQANSADKQVVPGTVGGRGNDLHRLPPRLEKGLFNQGLKEHPLRGKARIDAVVPRDKLLDSREKIAVEELWGHLPMYRPFCRCGTGNWQTQAFPGVSWGK